MPVGKDIYDQMGKFRDRKKRMEKTGPAKEPPTVEQFKKNKVTRTKSRNVHIVDLAGPRAVSPTEGMPAVNGKSGEEVVKKAVTKTKPKATEIDPTAGAIVPLNTRQKKCGLCREPGHTKRNCPRKDD